MTDRTPDNASEPELRIGPYQLDGRTVLAPMVGVTDLPFRRLCREYGAALAAGEMTAANPELRNTMLGQRRRCHDGEPSPRVVQIAGGDPQMMADAARFNVDEGAQIIDINMGCPNKKVCRQAAGSALLSDEPRVAAILEATVAAVDVPVTLKIRTGPAPVRRNGVNIARIAEASGIAALAVHGRTRADRFRGQAEYRTIAEIVEAVDMPVFANGDIRTPQDAKRVLDSTGAAGVMIGRAAQGRPWIFREIDHYLVTGRHLPAPTPEQVHRILDRHLLALYEFYGEALGTRIARKHVGWYLDGLPGLGDYRRRALTADSADEQRGELSRFFSALELAA